MQLTKTIPDALVETVVRGIMDNFPEASGGCALRCVTWRYNTLQFVFHDTETDRDYHLSKSKILAAFPLIFTDKWPKGCRL